MALRKLVIPPNETVVLWEGTINRLGEIVYFPEPIAVSQGVLAYGIYVPSGEGWVVPADARVRRHPDGAVRYAPWTRLSLEDPVEVRRKTTLHVMESNAEYYSAVTEGDQ